MTHLFHRKKQYVNTDNFLLNQLIQFDDDLKQRFLEQSEETKSTHCLGGFFSCIKTSVGKIPNEYKEIASWLTKLSTAQAKGAFDESVLVTALYASLRYVSEDTVGSELPAKIIKELIEEVASQFQLNLNIEPDYTLLKDYCMAYSIVIPEAIKAVIASNQLANLIA